MLRAQSQTGGTNLRLTRDPKHGVNGNGGSWRQPRTGLDKKKPRDLTTPGFKRGTCGGEGGI